MNIFVKVLVFIFINSYLFAVTLGGSVIIDSNDHSFNFNNKTLEIEDVGNNFGSVIINSPGSFVFPNNVADNIVHTYNLVIKEITNNNQYICTINEPSGTVFLHDKTDLVVLCKGKYYISVKVSGLSNTDTYTIADNNQTLSFDSTNSTITQNFSQWYYANFNYYLKSTFNYNSLNYKKCSKYKNSNITNNVNIYISCNISNFNQLYYQPNGRVNATSWKDSSGNIYLFGGFAIEYYNDLWKFSEGHWTQIIANGATGSPSARADAVSWTDHSGNAYVFGGFTYNNGVTCLNDLWKFSEGHWTQIIANGATGSPSARGDAVSWTDNAGNAYVFGGDTRNYENNNYNDLWQFNGTSWHQIIANGTSNSPSGRSNAISWTDNAGNVYVFGGVASYTYGYNLYNDLWKFNGTSWTQIINVGNTPSGRYGAVSWTDNYGNEYVFGGWYYDLSLNDLWKFNGTSWTQITNVGTSPSARYGAVSWTNNDGAYVFGGFGYVNRNSTLYNDLWRFNGTNWTQIFSNAVNTIPPSARNGAVSWTDNNGNAYVFGGSGNNYFNDLWKFNGTNWMPIINVGIPPNARTGAVAWTDNNGNAYVFGGVGNSFYNDLWKFNGTNWTQLTNVGTSPSARYGAVSWTDSYGNGFIFGGVNASNYYNDLWKFNGTSWTQIINAGTSPSGRYGAVSWTDNNGNVYVFGGVNASNYYNDLWKFDGTSWTQLTNVGTSPSARYGAVSWTDNIGNAYVLGGYTNGKGVNTYYNDLWKFNGTSWTQITNITIPATEGAVSWIDNSGSAYIFGGYNGNKYSNDLYII